MFRKQRKRLRQLGDNWKNKANGRNQHEHSTQPYDNIRKPGLGEDAAHKTHLSELRELVQLQSVAHSSVYIINPEIVVQLGTAADILPADLHSPETTGGFFTERRLIRSAVHQQLVPKFAEKFRRHEPDTRHIHRRFARPEPARLWHRFSPQLAADSAPQEGAHHMHHGGGAREHEAYASAEGEAQKIGILHRTTASAPSNK